MKYIRSVVIKGENGYANVAYSELDEQELIIRSAYFTRDGRVDALDAAETSYEFLNVGNIQEMLTSGKFYSANLCTQTEFEMFWNVARKLQKLQSEP